MKQVCITWYKDKEQKYGSKCLVQNLYSMVISKGLNLGVYVLNRENDHIPVYKMYVMMKIKR